MIIRAILVGPSVQSLLRLASLLVASTICWDRKGARLGRVGEVKVAESISASQNLELRFIKRETPAVGRNRRRDIRQF